MWPVLPYHVVVWTTVTTLLELISTLSESDVPASPIDWVLILLCGSEAWLGEADEGEQWSGEVPKQKRNLCHGVLFKYQV